MAAALIPLLTPEDYLRQERQADFRSEFVNGQVYAMSGGTRVHSVLIAAFAYELNSLLGDRPCLVTVSDLRLQIGLQSAYVYPDVMVTCGALQPADWQNDIAENAVVVVEVLSASTERYDRTGKFALYRKVTTLEEYVLVSQDESRVEWYTRNDQGNWEYREAVGDEGVCHLARLGVAVSLRSLYRNVPGLDPADGPNS